MKAARCPHVIDALTLLWADETKPTLPGLKQRIVARFSQTEVRFSLKHLHLIQWP